MVTLILDCDGVLADTERDGHLVAFNAAFAEAGLATRWSEAEYGRLLRVGGGKERLRALFSAQALVADPALPLSRDKQDALIRELHARKTELFVSLCQEGRLPGRPGIARVVNAALDADWQVAVASTSAEQSVRAVLESVVGPGQAARFAGVFAGDVVARKKPAPDIYLLACERLSTGPGDAVVVEDSGVGAAAASRAGLGHLVTVSSFTANDEFPDAAAVVSSLGEADSPLRVVSSRVAPPPSVMVGLDDLRRAASVAVAS